MPYKSKEAKQAHNKKYKLENRAMLEVQRLKRSSQKSISRKTFDLIKDVADDELLARFKIMKSLTEKVRVEGSPTFDAPEPQLELEPQQSAPTPVVGTFRGSTSGFYTRGQKTVISIARVKEIHATMYRDGGNSRTQKKEQSMIRNIPLKIGCPNSENDDFMCAYKDIKKTVEQLKKGYKRPMDQTNLLLKLINSSKEIRANVSKKDYTWLSTTTADLQRKQNAKTIVENKKRAEDTDWETEYQQMVNYEPKTDDLKMFKEFLLHGTADKNGKLQMIPRNYFINDKIVNIVSSVNQATNERKNYYIPTEGRLIINNFKTDQKYAGYNYVLPDRIKKMFNDAIKKDKRTNLFPKLGDAFPISVGQYVRNYRRIMSFKWEEKIGKGTDKAKFLIAKAMGNDTATRELTYATQ